MIIALAIAIAVFLGLGFGLRLVEPRLVYDPRPLPPGRLAELLDGTPPGDGIFEEVSFRTPDGEALVGWLGRPAARPPAAWVLWCHGNAGSVEHRFLDLVRFVRECGFGVLVFDYRGYGRSTGKPTEEGLYVDAEAALDFLAARAGVPPEEIAVLGRSLGGAVAVELAGRRTVRCLVLESTFTSAADMAKKMIPLFPARWFMRSRFATDAKIGALELPILLFHGRRDEIVPFEHGERLAAAARADRTTFVPVDTMHNDLSETLGRTYFERVAAFVASR